MSKEDSPPAEGPPSTDTSVMYEVRRFTVNNVPLDLYKKCRKLSKQTADQSIMKEDTMTFVLFRNGVPVGFGTVYDPGARMLRLDTETGIPHFRDYDTKTFIIDVFCTDENQEGFGTRILAAIEAYARSVGKTRLQLLSLPGAKKFYLKNGFKPMSDSMADLDLEKVLSGGRRRRKTRRNRRVR